MRMPTAIRALPGALLIALALWAGNAVQASTESTQTLLTQGDAQWKEGRLDDAQKSFQAALAASPQSVPVRLKLAGLQLSSNDFGACIPSYQAIISLDASNVRAWLGLGFSYLHTGKNSLSLAAFNEAIRLDPAKKAALQPMLAKLQTP